MAELLDVEVKTKTAPAPAAPMPVRAAIAVVMTYFPRIDETFILREINELERNGQPVLVVPITHGMQRVIHEEAKPWVRRALYTPFFSFAILRSNVRALLTEPMRYLRLVKTLVAGTIWRPSTLVRTLAVVPKGVHLARVLGEMGIHHVHSHFATHATSLAYIISSMSDITYSFTVHGPDVFVHRLLLREKIRKASFVRCVSTFNKAFLTGLYPRESEGKVEVVRSGLDPVVYADAARHAPREEAAGTRPALIVTVAALSPRHGYPFLIDACARLVKAGLDIECRIVGDGPLRDETERWIAQQGLSDRVKILGNLPQHEVARLMGAADVFVTPNIIAVDGQMDGIPISLMEAMAAGKPVVASAISGIPELVQNHVSGILVDAAYAEKLADAIRTLIENPQLRERLGQAGQKTVSQSFHVRRTARALLSLFDRGQQAPKQTIADSMAALNWSRLGVQALGVRRVTERAQSTIVEMAVSDGVMRRDVIVRQARPDPENREAAFASMRNEFESMSVLRQSMDSAEPNGGGTVYSLPRLLMFDEPHGAIVMERADGVSLAGLMRDARRRGRVQRLRVALRKSVTWLRTMQQHTRGDEDGRYVLTAVVLLALRDLDLAAAGDASLRRQHASIRDRLRELESRAGDEPMPVVGRHGSFRPENIFIGDRRVDVIDFSRYREGLPLEDVAELLVRTEVAFATPLLRARWPQLQREILSGFGATPDSAALHLFTAASALRMLSCLGDDDPVSLRWRRRVLRRIVRRSLA
ncbi:MAG TPA: glycosyltransferase family 4 protein [Thermoanaerobaculia bacterium]|nr:glycosyltransferase family 4 protein [Thermoanaerobaculia bacterium]